MDLKKIIIGIVVFMVVYFIYHNVEINWKEDSHAVGASDYSLNDEGIGAPWGLGWWYKGSNMVDPITEMKENRSIIKEGPTYTDKDEGESTNMEEFENFKKRSLKENGIENFTLNSAPLDYEMGNYSNVYINGKDDSHDLKKLVYTSFGTPNPLNDIIPLESKFSNATNVDGTPNSPRSMAMFKYNNCDAKCCPSTYSCSKGCVCQTDNQKNFLNTRGNNRTLPTEY